VSITTRLGFSTAVLSLLVLLAAGCPKQKQVPPPEPPPGEAPIDKMLDLLDRKRSDLSLPRSEEAGYRLPMTYPVVDAVLAQPLAMAPWAEQLGTRLDAAVGAGQLWAALRTLSPAGSAADLAPREAPQALQGSPPPRLRLTSPAPLPRDAFASKQALVQTEQLPETFVTLLIELAGLLQDLEAEAESWYRLDGLIRRPDRAAEEFFIDRNSGEFRFWTHPVGVQLEFLRSAVFIDQQAISRCAGRMMLELERLLPALATAAQELPASKGLLLHLPTRLGPIIVGSTGSDLHRDDAFLLIDPGGADQWHNNAGSNVGLNTALALAVDLGGNDQYLRARGHTQGSGFLGIGMLVDWGDGTDQYAAGPQSQGAGFMGIGMLWDRGGNDSYRSSGFAQGAGTFGIGILLDEGGNDRAVASGRAQGFASSGGLGAYLDLAGDDERRIGLPGSKVNSIENAGGQGAAWGTRPYPWSNDLSLHGGVGLLYDRAGNDRNFTHTQGQGSAWFLSLGLLLDRAGSDQYLCGESCQGSADHLAAALLLDSDGDDRYEGSLNVQGFGDDRSVGILWDRGAGSDLYRLAEQGRRNPADVGRGQGYARQPHALGMLVDGGGDDLYVSFREALGHAEPSRHPGRNPTALLIDLAGLDRYTEGQSRAGAIPRDSSTWLHGEHAAGLDTFVASPGWDGGSFEPAEGFAPLGWKRGLLEPAAPVPVEAAPEGEPEGAAAPADGGAVAPEGDVVARWTWLRNRYRERVTSPTTAPLTEKEVGVLQALAGTDPSVSVRREAARLLVSAGDIGGLRILIASLSQASQDNPGGVRGTGELGAFLNLVTGTGLNFSSEQWSRWFQSEGRNLDLKARWPAVALLEAAAVSATNSEVEKMAEQCSKARELLPEDPWVDARSGSLVGRWAWLLGHPESHANRNPKLAVELATLWSTWQPDTAQPFIALGQAWFTQGEYELANLALDKSAILDPDNIRMLALRRAMEKK